MSVNFFRVQADSAASTRRPTGRPSARKAAIDQGSRQYRLDPIRCQPDYTRFRKALLIAFCSRGLRPCGPCHAAVRPSDRRPRAAWPRISSAADPSELINRTESWTDRFANRAARERPRRLARRLGAGAGRPCLALSRGPIPLAATGQRAVRPRPCVQSAAGGESSKWLPSSYLAHTSWFFAAIVSAVVRSHYAASMRLRAPVQLDYESLALSTARELRGLLTRPPHGEVLL